MLEPPQLPAEQVLACLGDAYGVQGAELQFLPWGADPDTAVFRLVAADGVVYFVKLRSGAFDTVTVAVPRLLHSQGNEHVIAPLLTRAGELHGRCAGYAVVLSPYVEGRNGFEAELAPSQWVALGRAVHGLHSAVVPEALAGRLAVETFAGDWREQVRAVLGRLESAAAVAWPWPAADGVARAVAALLANERERVSNLVACAERLAPWLHGKALPFVLCHADIHAGNVLTTGEGALLIVDWDTVMLAPKERDLMFIGAGIGGWQRPEQAVSFYRGYGDTAVDRDALAYYRCERVVQDIAVYCRDLLFTAAGGADREEQLQQLAGQFDAGSIVDLALESAEQSSLRSTTIHPFRK
jgi:spectinomycin phosphotransferase